MLVIRTIERDLCHGKMIERKVFKYLAIIFTVITWCDGFINGPRTTQQEQLCYNKPYGYKIADTTDCLGYFICHGAMIIQQYCPPGQRFYASLQTCQNGKCPPCDCQIDCSNASDGTLFGDCKHCRLFWQCISGRAVLRFCELGKWFDSAKYVCNYPDLVQNCPANQD
ncbi:protein obstructor-E [Zeugodacus cucurbitae]|uniref:protein obstructor-E n=1 Tax=Zeugodacus cucurbitae TaxID=28588 RepID=UPI0005968F25|nr:protein obstructor-E [Zeugodacus cucurbitae]